ncbi:MAG: RNA 2',3'-cyclic phosphodiesterase [candidate division Zixibacteria bacterium]|nr:RNA 2',3'-cyclic phosphodiesterase [candidate division Zixibacteria bacterium]
MRAFIAVELPSDVKNQIARMQAELRRIPAQVSWTKADNVHLTLKFLGEIGSERLQPVTQAARAGCKGVKKFRISLKGLGGFPNLRQPRVIWIGTQNGAEELISLQAKIDSELDKAGFPREEKKFRPHFTIGRVRVPKSIEKLAQALGNTEFQTADIDISRVTVMQSRLSPGGSIYTALEKIELEN